MAEPAIFMLIQTKNGTIAADDDVPAGIVPRRGDVVTMMTGVGGDRYRVAEVEWVFLPGDLSGAEVIVTLAEDTSAGELS